MKIAIIGNGRFGTVMNTFFWDNVVFIGDKDDDILLCLTADIIVLCIPMSALQSVHDTLIQKLTTQTILEVSSVKLFPQKIWQDYKNTIHTHPMFGPDSIKKNKWFSWLPRVFCESTKNKQSQWLDKFCLHQWIKRVSLTCDEHDRIASRSQWLAHFVWRMMWELKLVSHEMDTLWSIYLQDIATQTCNDTWELFSQLQHYNPYTQKMREDLWVAYNTIYHALLPQRKNIDAWVVWIQWWPWSFNEQSIIEYAKKNKIQNVCIKYLYTSRAVIHAVSTWEVDFWHFAVCNSRGWIVKESIQSIADYQYKVIDVHVLSIHHFLMKKKLSDPTHVMAHPQVLAQCHDTLAKEYSYLEKKVWQGDMIDTAVCAQALSRWEVETSVAILWPKVLADMYDFDIISDNLADDPHNKTSFFVITRPDNNV